MDHKREYWRYCKGSSRWALASEACEMPKDMAAYLVSGLFGLPAKIAVERRLAEFGAGRPDLIAAADPNHELPDAGLLLSVEAEALGRFRQQLVESLRIAATSRVPLEGAEQAQFVVFRDGIGGSPAAIVIGEPDLAQPVLVRL